MVNVRDDGDIAEFSIDMRKGPLSGASLEMR